METDFISYAQESVNNATMIYGGDERWSKVFWNQFPQEQPKQMCGCTQQHERTQGLCCSQLLAGHIQQQTTHQNTSSPPDVLDSSIWYCKNNMAASQ